MNHGRPVKFYLLLAWREPELPLLLLPEEDGDDDRTDEPRLDEGDDDRTDEPRLDDGAE